MAQLQEGTLVSSTHGDELRTYAWEVASPKGFVFLEHGLHGCTTHEFYAPPTSDSNGAPGCGQFSGSVVEQLCRAGLSVFAHDRRGHGKSAGLRAYFTIPELVSDSLQFVDSVTDTRPMANTPVFLCGVSMGGTVALLMDLARPDYFRGATLVSPAVKEPENSFGPFGALLASASAGLAAMMPRVPVLQLPLPPIKEVADYWLADDECYHGKLRTRPGRDMIVAYRTLETGQARLRMPMTVFIGTEDSLVSASGIQEFFKGVGSADVTVRVCEGMWHVLFIEKGGDEIIQDAVKWIVERALQPVASG